MPGKDARVEKLLALTSLRIHPNKYIVATSPTSTINSIKQRLADIDSQYWSIISSEEEISLILPANTWAQMSSYLPKAKIEEDYRLITLDAPTSWDTPGYLTKILSILTQENITVGVISGFSRHHLIIKSKNLLQAIDSLNQTIEFSQ